MDGEQTEEELVFAGDYWALKEHTPQSRRTVATVESSQQTEEQNELIYTINAEEQLRRLPIRIED